MLKRAPVIWNEYWSSLTLKKNGKETTAHVRSTVRATWLVFLNILRSI